LNAARRRVVAARPSSRRARLGMLRTTILGDLLGFMLLGLQSA
jgi:hypothetical protein